MCCTSSTVLSGERQIGSLMNPFLNFLTLYTSLACSSMDTLEWMIPILNNGKRIHIRVGSRGFLWNLD